MTTFDAMVARCRVDSVHVLTFVQTFDAALFIEEEDSAVTGAQFCQYSSCLPWQSLFGCGNGRRSAIKQS